MNGGVIFWLDGAVQEPFLDLFELAKAVEVKMVSCFLILCGGILPCSFVTKGISFLRKGFTGQKVALFVWTITHDLFLQLETRGRARE